MKPILISLILTGPLFGYENLLENGDFRENQTGRELPAGWSPNVHLHEGAAGEVTWDNGALKVVNRSPKAAWVRASQQPIAARQERLYRFAGRARGNARVLFVVYEFRTGKKPYLTHNLAQFIPGQEWQWKSGIVKTGPDADFFKVSLISNQAGEVWFDDATLWDLGDPPSLVVPATPRERRTEPFFILDGRGKESSEPTRAFLSYDRNALHARFECMESQVPKIKRASKTDGMSVFADDCIELFLNPSRGQTNYFQIGVNAEGARGFVRRSEKSQGFFTSWHDSPRTGKSPKWTPNVKATASIKGDRWEVTLTVPWKTIGVTPRPGLVIRANFTRRRNLGGEENASWALMEGTTFHDPSQWGRLILAADASSPVGRALKSPKLPAPPVIPSSPDVKPAFGIRAFHTQAPLSTQLEEYKRLVRTLAKLRYNTLFLEVNEKLQYERHPRIASPTALSKPEMRKLVKFCQGLGFEVIPQVQTFGHFSYALRHDAYRSLSENAVPHQRWGFWNYCPSNPKTYKLVFDLFEEVIEVFKPKRFHIGHDEITFAPIGVCERCKGTPGHELFANEVLKLHAWLKKRELEVMMWGDHLLAEHNGRPPYNTAKALDQMPRDIVICDWHYRGDDDFPSVRFFKKQGFPVIACGWFNPVNVSNFTKAASEASAEGYCMTTWWRPERIANTARTAAAVALSAQFAWSPKQSLDKLPWHPGQAFRQIHFPARPKAAFRALDISGQAYSPLSETDVAAAPQGILAANGVPFAIGDQVIVLDKNRPKVWQTPVGGRVRSLHFLHCTTRPPRNVDHLYDRHRVLPGLVGFVIVHYADGSSERVRLLYRRNITQWNSRLGAGECDLAWQGRRKDGALVTLCAWEWLNPHPEKPVAGIDMARTGDKVDLMVLAITAAGGE
ncbi:MAG: carbohydrate-binding family 9-like protein [Planctomycetota bacterium]|jgi:hypothetical protein|nr:carbohydrate-binding family 9-like protein [Planctomycetota bacterium]